MGEEADRVAMVSDLLAVERRVEKLDTRVEKLDARIEKLEEKLDTSISDVLAIVAHEGEKTRRHFDMVAEQMRSEFKVVAERTMATDHKVDRLIAQNAIEHAAFVEAIADHEVRQRVIEKMHEPPRSS